MMAVMMMLYHVKPGWNLLLLPVWLGFIVLLALGIALFTSAWSITYRDVGYIVPIFVQFWMYASPVAYAVSAVPGKLSAFYFLNPLSGFLEMFRLSLLNRGHIGWGFVLYSVVFTLTVFYLGAFTFRRAERPFAFYHLNRLPRSWKAIIV